MDDDTLRVELTRLERRDIALALRLLSASNDHRVSGTQTNAGSWAEVEKRFADAVMNAAVDRIVLGESA